MPFLFENNYEKKNIGEPSCTQFELLSSVELTEGKRSAINLTNAIEEYPDFYITQIDAGSYYLQIDKIELERVNTTVYYGFHNDDTITLTLYGTGIQYGGTDGLDLYFKGIPSFDTNTKRASLLSDEFSTVYFKIDKPSYFYCGMKYTSQYDYRIKEATVCDVKMKLFKIH